MRVFWEQTGVLLPVYRLAGQGFSDAAIANRLNITELKVQSCMAWLLRFLRLNHRGELVRYCLCAQAGKSADQILEVSPKAIR